VVAYLLEVGPLRKPGTLREAKRITFEALPYLDPHDPKAGVLVNLNHCKTVLDNDPRTLHNNRVRDPAPRGVTLVIFSVGSSLVLFTIT
jgi:hypothetical protein